jgi:hypothetical protein
MMRALVVELANQRANISYDRVVKVMHVSTDDIT